MANLERAPRLLVGLMLVNTICHHSASTPKQKAYLSRVDELVGEALGDGLDVPEGRLPGPRAKQPDGLQVTK